MAALPRELKPLLRPDALTVTQADQGVDFDLMRASGHETPGPG